MCRPTLSGLRTPSSAVSSTSPRNRAYYVHYPPEIGYGIPRVALQSLRPVLEQYGLAGGEELARLDRELDEATGDTAVQWVSSPLMIEWIARRA